VDGADAPARVRHPREHPDVDPFVLVEELVAPALAVDDDERLPQILPVGKVADELLERLGRHLPGLVQQLRGSRGKLGRERLDLDGVQLFDRVHG